MSNSQWFRKVSAIVMSLIVTLGYFPQLFIQALAESATYEVRFHATYRDEHGMHTGSYTEQVIQVNSGETIGDNIDSSYLYPEFEGGAIQYWNDSRDYWYSSSGNQAYQGSNFYTPEEVKDIVPDSEMDLYAHYVYNVQVDYAGGTDSLGQTSTTLVLPELENYYTGNLEIPNNSDGKMFAGWGSDTSDDAISYFTPTQNDHRLVALWADNFKVTLKANGGTFSDGSDTLIGYVAPYAAYNSFSGFELPTRPGYRIYAWYNSDIWRSLDDMNDYQVSKNITLTAEWESSVTITLNANGGTFDNGESTYTYQTSGNEIYTGNFPQPTNSDPNKPFMGWVRANGEFIQSDVYYNFEDGEVLNAIWSGPATVTVINSYDNSQSTYNINTGERLGDSDIAYNIGVFRDNANRDPSLLFAGYSLNSVDSGNILAEYQLYNYLVTGDVTLYLVWGESCKVTFHSGDQGYFYSNEEWNEDTGDYEYVYVRERTSTKAKGSHLIYSDVSNVENVESGWYFVGWTTTSDGTGEIYTSEQVQTLFTITENTDFYAAYIQSAVITLDYNGGVDSSGNTFTTFNKEPGEAIYTWELPSITYQGGGKILKGWSTSQQEFIEAFVDGEVYSSGSSDKHYPVNGSATLYAFWEDGYTATFHTGTNGYFVNDNGDHVTEKQFGVAINGYLDRYVEEPKGIDCFFSRWSLRPDGTGEKFTIYQLQTGVQFDSDKDFYAVYVSGDTVTYDFNGGHDSDNNTSRNVIYQKNSYVWGSDNPTDIEYPDTTKVLAGWSTSPTEFINAFENDYYHLSGDVTFYAWYEDACTVTIHSGDNGYYYSNEVWDDMDVHYEYVREKTFTVAKGSNLSKYYDDIYYSPNTNNGYFMGYSRNSDGSGEVYTTYNLVYNVIINENTDFYAVYDKGATITLDYYGGIGHWGPQTSFNIKKGSYLYPNELSDYYQNYPNNSKSFVGWSMSPTEYISPFEEIDDGSMSEERYIVNGDVTFYAYWESGSENDVAIHFDFNGGFDNAGNSTRTYTYSPGTSLYFGNTGFPRAFYSYDRVFEGWSTRPDGNISPFNEENYIINTDLTLYAIWEDECRVTFDANGGYFVGEVDASNGSTAVTDENEHVISITTPYNYHQDMSQKFPAQEIMNENTILQFVGWNTEQDGSGETVDISNCYVTSDMTLYAQWMDPTTVVITKQPEDVYAETGETTVVSIEAVGEGLTYTWYFRNKGKTSWSKSTETTNQYTLEMTEVRDERQTYCVVKNASGKTVRSETVTYHITADLEITKQPESATVRDGQQLDLSVEATGIEVTYRWQYLEIGSVEWADSGLPGYDTDTLTVTLTEDKSGQQYRCIVTDKYGTSIESDIATVEVIPAIVITKQPEDVYAEAGETTVVSIEADGEGLTYTWYFRNAGKTSWSKSSETSSQYELEMTEARDGRQTYCIVKNASGKTVKSDTVTYHYVEILAITQQPEDVHATLNEQTVVSVEATGRGLTYTWYFRNRGKTTWSKSSETSSQYKMEMTEARDGRQTYCVVKDSLGNTIDSNVVTYYLEIPLEITSQPEDVYAYGGEQTVVSVGAQGKGLKYTWYFRNAGKTAWSKSSETSSQYRLEMTEARDGRQTYCVVRDSAGNTAESNVVTYHLMVPLEITSQPIDATAVENNAATFSIAATGEELAYQWQYLENGAAEWADSGLPGSDTDTITVLVTPDKSGQQYRCVVTDKYGETATSDAATLTVVNAVAITSEPEDVYAFDGEQTVVSVGAEGEGLTYTWYYRNAGKTAWSRSSETSSQYRMEMTEARDGRQTYCIVRDAGGNSARSRTVTYHLKTPLAVTAQPANAAVIEGNAATFTVEADGDGLTYQWETSTDSESWSAVSGATANEYTVTAQLSQSGTYYRCVITDAYGESVETNTVQLLVSNGNETPIDEPEFNS